MLSLLKSYTILYAEDDIVIQKNIKEYLENYFNKVYVASDGDEAFKLYTQYHPSVLLLDIHLPYLSGLALAKKIRKKDLSVKIIMLTAYSETEQLLVATELKLTKYLLKPFSPRLFIEALELLANELSVNSSNFIYMDEEYIWDKRLETLYKNGTKVNFSEKEYRLIRFLMLHKGKAIMYEELMLEVWEDSFEREISIESVKNQVSLLRKKLPKGCIVSVYGKGYLFR